MLVIAVGEHNIDDARLQNEDLLALLPHLEQSLSWLVEPLLRPVEELPKDVLISIP